MQFYAKSFNELTTEELYEILKSRSEIFLLEQGIVCQDMDGVDYDSMHCFFSDNKRIVGYLRAFCSQKDTVTIGRVLTLEHRKGLGTELMNRSIEEIKHHFQCTNITVHAQKQAVAFYEKLGFYITSDEFLEEGIPHITMEKRI